MDTVTTAGWLFWQSGCRGSHLRSKRVSPLLPRTVRQLLVQSGRQWHETHFKFHQYLCSGFRTDRCVEGVEGVQGLKQCALLCVQDARGVASGMVGTPGSLLERLKQVPQLHWGHHAGGAVPHSPQGVRWDRVWQNTGEF
jgi:hypothetical protein